MLNHLLFFHLHIHNTLILLFKDALAFFNVYLFHHEARNVLELSHDAIPDI